MEVEVAPSGEWRVAGEPAWRSILEPAPAAGPAPSVKAEAPAAAPHGAATPAAGQANGNANGVGGHNGVSCGSRVPAKP